MGHSVYAAPELTVDEESPELEARVLLVTPPVGSVSVRTVKGARTILITQCLQSMSVPHIYYGMKFHIFLVKAICFPRTGFPFQCITHIVKRAQVKGHSDGPRSASVSYTQGGRVGN